MPGWSRATLRLVAGARPRASDGPTAWSRWRRSPSVGEVAASGNTRQELVQLIQLLVVEGAKVMAAFGALHGLHPTDVGALTRVLVAEEQGTPLTAGALGKDLGLTSGAITGVVDRLERAGHVHRVRDDTDRRKVLLRYSARGRALAEEFFAPLGRHTDTAMDQFTPEELEGARRFLAVTGASMAAVRQPLTPLPAGKPAPAAGRAGRPLDA